MFPREHLGAVTNADFLRFPEVSNEVVCWLGVKRKGRKIGAASMTDSSMWPTNSNPLSVAGSVLKGSRCGNPRWHQFLSFPAMWFPAMAAGVAFQESNAACNCFGANRKNKVAPHRRRYQQHDPQTIIFRRGFFSRLWNVARKIAWAWNKMFRIHFCC